MKLVMSLPSERQVAVSAIKLLINNRWIAGESGKILAIIDPVLERLEEQALFE
jgi:hypothetical protein